MEATKLVLELIKQIIDHDGRRHLEGKDMLGPAYVRVCDEEGAFYRRFQVMLDHDGTILLVPTNHPE